MTRAGFFDARAIAAMLRVPRATVHRWAAEDRWRRLRTWPRRYHWGDVQATYLRRRDTPAD